MQSIKLILVDFSHIEYQKYNYAIYCIIQIYSL